VVEVVAEAEVAEAVEVAVEVLAVEQAEALVPEALVLVEQALQAQAEALVQEVAVWPKQAPLVEVEALVAKVAEGEALTLAVQQTLMFLVLAEDIMVVLDGLLL